MSEPTDKTDPRFTMIEILSKARAELAYTFYQPEIEKMVSPDHFRKLEQLLIDLRDIRDGLKEDVKRHFLLSPKERERSQP